MLCCKYALCVPCGRKIAKDGVLKCPQCRVEHDESVLDRGVEESEEQSMAEALAASLSAFEEEKKHFETLEAEWAQNLDAALQASMLTVSEEKAEDEGEMAAAMAESLKCSQAASAASSACALREKKELDELNRALRRSKQVRTADEAALYEALLASKREHKRALYRGKFAATSVKKEAKLEGILGMDPPADEELSMDLLLSAPVKTPKPAAKPAAKTGKVRKGNDTDNTDNTDDEGPVKKRAKVDASEYTGFKVIRTRGLKASGSGKSCLSLTTEDGKKLDVPVDVSLQAALKLSLRPQRMFRLEREREEMGLPQDECCKGDPTKACSSTCPYRRNVV